MIQGVITLYIFSPVGICKLKTIMNKVEFSVSEVASSPVYPDRLIFIFLSAFAFIVVIPSLFPLDA